VGRKLGRESLSQTKKGTASVLQGVAKKKKPDQEIQAKRQAQPEDLMTSNLTRYIKLENHKGRNAKNGVGPSTYREAGGGSSSS